jgi:hypothetical protein
MKMQRAIIREESGSGKRIGWAYGYAPDGDIRRGWTFIYADTPRIAEEIGEPGSVAGLYGKELASLEDVPTPPRRVKLAMVKHMFEQAGVKGDDDENVV